MSVFNRDEKVALAWKSAAILAPVFKANCWTWDSKQRPPTVTEIAETILSLMPEDGDEKFLYSMTGRLAVYVGEGEDGEKSLDVCLNMGSIFAYPWETPPTPPAQAPEP